MEDWLVEGRSAKLQKADKGIVIEKGSPGLVLLMVLYWQISWLSILHDIPIEFRDKLNLKIGLVPN